MALPNDMSRQADILAGQSASDPYFTNNTKKSARRFIRRSYTFGRTEAVNANGSNAILANANPCRRMDVAGRVLGAYAVADTAATSHASNNATIAVKALSPTLGNSSATVASGTTSVTGLGNVVVGVPLTLTVDSANARYVAGQVLAPEVSENASGVAMGKVSVTIDVEEEDIDSYPV